MRRLGISRKEFQELDPEVRRLEMERAKCDLTAPLLEQKLVDPKLAEVRARHREEIAKLENRRTATIEGFVYVIMNPAWPGMVKIGSALDPESRLRNYQTGDPHRAYELRGYAYYPDRLLAESRVLEALKDRNVSGEWFRIGVAEALRVVQTVPLEER